MNRRNGGSGHRGGNVGGGRPRHQAWLEDASPRRDWEKFRSWGDTIRWPLVAVLAAMVAVTVGEFLWIADAARPDTAALLTGAAAVVSAIAAVIEAKRGGDLRGNLADHEARLRVLEDRARRPGA